MYDRVCGEVIVKSPLFIPVTLTLPEDYLLLYKLFIQRKLFLKIGKVL